MYEKINHDILKKQIVDAAGNVQYTFIAHWNIVNRLKWRYQVIKIVQIVLTAVSAGGFLAVLLSGIPKLSWIGGLTSVVALGINLYILNFDLPNSIKHHSDAANELWEVRENYKSLIVDFDSIEIEKVREKRDELTKKVSCINKNYPGTDEKSFEKAKKEMAKYGFAEGEAANIINVRE